jgi:hypothetical protein
MDAADHMADLQQEMVRAHTVVRQTVAELTVGRRRPTAAAEPRLMAAGLLVTAADLIAGQLLPTEEADQPHLMGEAVAPADLAVAAADTRHRAAEATVVVVAEGIAAVGATATAVVDVTKSN